MTRVLVTAFGGFPGAPRNPTAQALAWLDRFGRRRLRGCGIALSVAELPVLYAIAPILDACLARARPDLIVMMGYSARRKTLAIERRARNRASILRRDAGGRVATSLILRARAPASRATLLPTASLRRGFAQCGLPARISNDAGDYICNAAYWRALERGRAVFIHVPAPKWAPPAQVAAALAQILAQWSHRARL